MSLFRHFLLPSVLILALALTGCGTKYQPVTGEIVFPDGKPVTGLRGGQIVFQKAGSAGEAATAATNSASGPIDENGKFTLGTDQVADGAPEGEYQVIITPPQPTGDEIMPKVIDPKYTKVGGSTKTYTVKKGDNHFKIEVEPAK